MTLRHLTPITPGRANRGPQVARISTALVGRPPMPWQGHAAVLSTEMLPDGSWAYRTLYVSTPRQAGKTTIRSALAVDRCLHKRYARVWLTAQTRQAARDILIDEVAERFVRSPLAPLGRVRKSQGSEGITFATGSTWRVFAPTEGALDGKANELVDLDEGWTLDAVTGGALDNSIGPTFTTTGGQFSVFSTAGNAASTWLRGKYDAAAAGNARTAIIDIGLTDDEAARVRVLLEEGPDTPAWEEAIATLLATHPAHGHTVDAVAIDEDCRRVLARTEDGGIDGILRAYGNVWIAAANQVIPASSWNASRPEVMPTPSRPLALAIDVGLDRVDATIAAAWWSPDRARIVVDVIAHQPGTHWVRDRLEQLLTAHQPAAVAAAGHGPVLALADDLELAGIRLVRLTVAEYATACQGLLTAVPDGRLTQPGHPGLDAAVANAALRRVGDTDVWSHRKSTASISPLTAVTIARWALAHHLEQTLPDIYTIDTLT